MEILETKAYSIPFINIDQNSTLMFKDQATRNSYFDSNGTVLTNNVVKDVWRLYVDYLMTDGIPHPRAGTYNYFRFKLKTFDYLFFYVYDYEVKGAGQILYKLKLDTLQTYYLNTNKFQTIGEQLVYREHKDRFNQNKQPIIDQTLESLDIKPRIVEHVKTYPQREAKLALTKIGGGVKDGNILSKAMYFWKVHSMFPLTNNLRVNNQDFELMLGWGVSADTYGTGKTMRLTYIPKTRPSFTLTINFNEQFTFGYGNVPNKNYKGLYIAGDKTWEGRYTVNPPGNTEVGFTDVSYTTDKKWIYFVEDGRLFIDIVTSNFDFRINYDMGIDGYDSSKTFIKRIYNGGMANPFGESQLTESALETQQIISIPDITMLDLKGFGTNDGRGVYIPLNQEINEKIYNVENDVTNLIPSFTTTFYPAMTRIKHNEPKLLHSQFNTLFFTLQNEQIPLKLENTNNDNKIKLRLNLNNSNYFKALLTLENASKNMLYNELYELEKVINMNNEHVVIKSEINEYIDLHAKNEQRLNELQINKAERDLVYKGIGQVVSVGGGIAAGAISGTMVGGPVGTVAGAVAGAATGLVKGALNIAQGIQNLNQLKEEIKLQYDSKIKSLAYSLINVTGLSPDLAQKQELNKLKLFQFKLLDYEKDYLDLYFHNFGYQTLEYKIPNLRSRKYFNFIQMELVNYHINNRLITAEIIEDIKSRFRTGVTLFHYNETDLVKIDDQKQYENFERIFEGNEEDNDYYNYALAYYTTTGNSALFENAWEHSLIVDPLEISADGSQSNNRGTAQYPNGETEGVIIPRGVTTIGNYAFYNWDSNNKPLVIPDSVTYIGEGAFYNWDSNNQPLVIPDSVTSIGDGAFYGWNSNNHPLVIPSSVTSIGLSAFGSWYANEHPLIIPNSVTSIEDYAFQNWVANNDPLVIPDSVTYIGEGAFYGWYLIPYVEIQAITPPTLSHMNAFVNQNDAPIYVPDESVEAYKTANQWSIISNRIFSINDK